MAVEKNAALKAQSGRRSGAVTPTAMMSPRGGGGNSGTVSEHGEVNDSAVRRGLSSSSSLAAAEVAAPMTAEATAAAVIEHFVEAPNAAAVGSWGEADAGNGVMASGSGGGHEAAMRLRAECDALRRQLQEREERSERELSELRAMVMRGQEDTARVGDRVRVMERGLEAVQRFTGVEDGDDADDLDIDTVISMMVQQQLNSVVGTLPCRLVTNACLCQSPATYAPSLKLNPQCEWRSVHARLTSGRPLGHLDICRADTKLDRVDAWLSQGHWWSVWSCWNRRRRAHGRRLRRCIVVWTPRLPPRRLPRPPPAERAPVETRRMTSWRSSGRRREARRGQRMEGR
jgi:hypothetical protein